MTPDEENYNYTWDDEEESPKSRCVVIGNGFDLECGLPTSYTNFLDFIACINGIYEDLNSDSATKGVAAKGYGGAFFKDYVKDHPDWIDEKVKNVGPDIARLIVDRIGMNVGYFDEWLPVIANRWCRHFEERREEKATAGKGWVDFEYEIARLIRLVEDSMVDDRRHKADIDDRIGCPSPGYVSEVIKMAFDDKHPRKDLFNDKYLWYDLTYRELRDRLSGELAALTTGLESYLRDYVGGIDPKPTPAVEFVMDCLSEVADNKDTCIINFNYTDTLDRLLRDRGIEVKTCYVHGRIGDGKTRNQMVLGMDEYLSNKKVESMTCFASFRKYNQRIFKRTDSSYMAWLRTFRDYRQDKREVIVFGHSLGASDHDILRQLMSLLSTRALICYHNEDSFNELLANMTAMMGKDYVIERTGSELRTLKFEDQTTV